MRISSTAWTQKQSDRFHAQIRTQPHAQPCRLLDFLGSARRRASGCQAVPQFAGQPGQNRIVLEEGQVPAGIRESEPNCEAGLDTHRAIGVRAVQ